MTRLFGDASYYLALLNANDELHSLAREVTPGLDAEIVTTAWVLTEVVDALSSPPNRPKAVAFVHDCEADPQITIVAPSRSLFDAGLALFARRPDKEWSLTDCISFVVMSDQVITDALSSDHHFEQAGFNILLK
jgi:predicted nucleic acid-binding protein